MMSGIKTLHAARGLRQSVVKYAVSLFIMLFFVKDIGFVTVCGKIRN
jgi:hypothetical protein